MLEKMNYTRLYTGPDGESHFEDVEVPLVDYNGSPFGISRLFSATAMNFRRNGAEYDLDWHNAPQRQFILNLTGQVRIEASDGEVRSFGPGSIMLADDTTGKGHKSQAIGDEERISIWVHVPENA